MLLTITYTGENTSDIGYLFYKNPAKAQIFSLSMGKAHVFYPEVSDEKTTIALYLDIDPIDLARGKAGSRDTGLFDYVNDRPYVCSSFMSTAISRVFGTAMTGRADDYQELSDSRLDLTACLTMLPCRGEHEMLRKVFEPLGYEVTYKNFITDEQFPEWGESSYVNLTIKGKVRLRDLLGHLFVLIPVFDRQKHYWISGDEVDKLLRHGEGWLADHPAKMYITRRYLNKNKSLARAAYKRLIDEEAEEHDKKKEEIQEKIKKRLNLNTQRMNKVMETVRSCKVSSVLDLGCGEGKLLSLLLKESQLKQVTGVDVSYAVLEKTGRYLKLNKMSDSQKDKLTLFQGSLTYRDNRFNGYEAASVIEVIEHLDKNRLQAFEKVLFKYARPNYIILTTPNKEYNVRYESLEESELRHGDHRFEWTRKEFENWAQQIAKTYQYKVEFDHIGEFDQECGAPTQMGVFRLCE